MTSDDFDPFAGGEILRVSPTTGPQKEIIASAKMSDEANTAFNESILIWISGDLDQDLLDACFRSLIDRHDILRAGFSRNGNDICLYDQRPFTLEYEDLSSLEHESQEKAIEELKLEASLSPMNLEEGPLFYAHLRKLSKSEHALMIVVHHIVCDGWSFGILLDELSTLYRQNGSVERLEEAPSFFEFAEQSEASQIANLDADFWRAKFVTTPNTLDLPLDKPRPPMRTFTAARIDYELGPELAVASRKKAAEMKASQVNLLMAVYFVLLHRLTSNQDIVIGMPTAGQASFDRLTQMGHLVQLLPIRVSLDGDTSFRELVGRVKSSVLDATEHPNFTFGSLLEKLIVDRTRVPLISTLFNIDQAIGELDLGTAKARVQTIPRTAENFELFLNLLPSEGKLTVEATYSTVLFSAGTVISWLQTYEVILREVLADSDLTLSKVRLTRDMPDVVKKVNATTLELTNSDFVAAFMKQVQLTPNSDAVIAGGITTSYSELEDYSNRLHSRLVDKGIKSGDVVGISVQRSVAMVASVLAVLKAGASYLPLDPDFPESRLIFMMEDLHAVAIIEDSTTPKKVKELNVIHIDPLSDLKSVKLCDHSPIDPQQPAYTIYTSGSTGIPKGVTISHHSLINFLEVMAKLPGYVQSDRVLAVTTLSFDMSLSEIYVPLISGACTIIASTEESKDGEKIAALIEKYQPTILQATPSMWKILMASSWAQTDILPSHNLRAFTGGEPLTADLANQLLPRVLELWNLYGPTEITVYATGKKVEDVSNGISIGYPIANSQSYILDEMQNLLPVSFVGELYVGGDGVAIGYHERDELNREKFIQHSEFGRLYRTGDLAKYLPNGEIDHLGRLDSQVKIRGYRVELGEIESALMKSKDVAQAAVYLWQLSADDVRIVACCLAQPGSSIASVAIRKQLRSNLPSYMIPQYILEVDKIPQLPNGKVDRASLPKPELNVSTILDKQALDTQLEKSIAGIWLDLINTSAEISKDDNFFEIGGHSLLALEAIRRIEQLSGIRITTADIVSKSLSSIAELLSSDTPQTVSENSGPEALPLSAPRTLSAEQDRILERQLSSPDNVISNLPAAWVIDGEINSDIFEKSLQRVFERQTALRTIISGSAGNYQQKLIRVTELELPENIDCSANPNADVEALRLANAAASEAFNVLSKPLIRTKLYRINSQRHLFLIIPHQLIFDGWSFDIFINELVSSYEALMDSRAIATDTLPFEFRDYCVWANQRAINQNDRTYHLERLKAADPPGTVDKIPARKNISRKLATFSKKELLELESRCEALDLRLHEFLYATFAVSLGAVLNRSRLTIGVSVSGRSNPDVVNLIGSFVSTLPCLIELENEDFIVKARSIAEQLDSFLTHQEISYAELFQTITSEDEIPRPDIHASIAFQDARNRSTTMSNLELKQIDIDRKQIEFPIEFWTRIGSKGFETILDYDAEAVEEKEIDEILVLLQFFMSDNQSGQGLDSKSGQPNPDKTAKVRSGWRKLFR